MEQSRCLLTGEIKTASVSPPPTEIIHLQGQTGILNSDWDLLSSYYFLLREGFPEQQ